MIIATKKLLLKSENLIDPTTSLRSKFYQITQFKGLNMYKIRELES